MYHCYVTRLKNVRPHPNADRLTLADCFGNTVCVDNTFKEGDLGVYFPTDGQLNYDFCMQNNLLRQLDENGKNIGGYLDPKKRHVTTVKLRGEPSDGLFLPLKCLAPFGDISLLKEGDQVETFNGVVIATKYIPKHKAHSRPNLNISKKTKKKINIAPLFQEHKDTEQLAYCINNIKVGDILDFSIKMHGTSQRTGYLPVLKGYKRSLLDRIFHRAGSPIYKKDYITGTRRTIVNNNNEGFYGTQDFRIKTAEIFKNKLWFGETVYYEVVGYVHDDTPIMASCDNKKLGQDFINRYGEKTVFNYGEPIDSCHAYVYRMTMTNEDGEVVEYTPEFMQYRCKQMGVDCVPHLLTLVVTENNIGDIMELAEMFSVGADPIGKTHIREGVVVRVVNKPIFTAYKHKNLEFKILEGIIKDNAVTPDIEEVEEDFKIE